MNAAEAAEEIGKLLLPLAEEAVVDVYEAVKAIVQHKQGAALAAKRTAEFLAAEAFIRS